MNEPVVFFKEILLTLVYWIIPVKLSLPDDPWYTVIPGKKLEGIVGDPVKIIVAGASMASSGLSSNLKFLLEASLSNTEKEDSLVLE